MPRLVLDGRRYDGLGLDALPRAEFVDLVLARSDLIFPGYIAIPFGTPHIYEQEEAVPDFALVRPDYSEWWVAVAHVGDAFTDEVLPAVEILTRTSYGILDAEVLLAAGSLNEEALVRLTREEQPRVIVIVSTIRFDWVDSLRGEAAILTIAEVFETDDGSRILRVNGEQPAPFGDVLSTCHIDPASPRLVQIADGASLGSTEELLIDYEGGSARWFRVDTGEMTCLYTSADSRLPHGRPFELIRGTDGRHLFRVMQVPDTANA
jgi:hypothetical protein